ncbi:MAG TPA: DUF2066 domain-containing protein [Steroidobacteraceae bacterium]|jgi:hypothetical protein|nr:DUF2066 domain-containing protein [Steroidobacteraceae bacterium]
MHRAREYLSVWRLWPLLCSAWTAVAGAAPVPSLYAAIVPESDPQRAAQLAMREVLVRLVGTRDAADDPALAGVIEEARRYVQVERNTTRGATQVIFDATALRSAVATAGRSVWDPERPLVWVVLPALGGTATDELRAQLSAEAAVRGLPIALVSADSPGAAGIAGAPAGGAAVLAAARRAGAGAALLAQPATSDPQTLQWSLLAPSAEGHWTGSAAAAIDGAADALVRASRELGSAPATEFDCRVAGVADLASFTAVLDSLGTAPGVTDLTIRAVDADQLTLHFKSRGGAAALTRVLAGERLRAGGSDGDGVLQYRYQSGL